jgi:hypothetical protein
MSCVGTFQIVTRGCEVQNQRTCASEDQDWWPKTQGHFELIKQPPIAFSCHCFCGQRRPQTPTPGCRRWSHCPTDREARLTSSQWLKTRHFSGSSDSTCTRSGASTKCCCSACSSRAGKARKGSITITSCQPCSSRSASRLYSPYSSCSGYRCTYRPYYHQWLDAAAKPSTNQQQPVPNRSATSQQLRLYCACIATSYTCPRVFLGRCAPRKCDPGLTSSPQAPQTSSGHCTATSNARSAVAYNDPSVKSLLPSDLINNMQSFKLRAALQDLCHSQQHAPNAARNATRWLLAHTRV